MFRSFARKYLPNPLDRMLKKLARQGGKKILLGWNRGLGDIALGLYAIVERIRELVPQAEITFMIRENLQEGFRLLEGVKTLIAPDWKRGGPSLIREEIRQQYDLVIEKPSPTDWVSWQHGRVVPRLKWDTAEDLSYEKFGLQGPYVGVQPSAETHYGLWRNWPVERWNELFDLFAKMQVPVLLFGFGEHPQFPRHSHVIDLRGKTTLFELLSIVKHKVSALVLPDSGITSMTYYLDASFPIHLVSLWADPSHGILKQRVASPNPQLVHTPLIAFNRDLSQVGALQVIEQLAQLPRTGAILLAGGQGTRLGFEGPKGLFPVLEKTLFQWIAEKIPKGFPLAIMTSPLNHEETVAYFAKNDFFGLDVHFFQQEMEEMLDENKQPTGELAPNGNGSLFRSFVKAGLKEVFEKKEIDFVTVNYIDNPLSQPYDPLFIAAARLQRAEILAQCIERQEKTDQSMGVFLEKEGKISVVEYTEKKPGHEARYAYSGTLGFSLSFFGKMAEKELPVHWVQKKQGQKTVWKAEQFLFDVFPYADTIRLFPVEREAYYAPLKGPDHLHRVETLLRQKS